MFDRRMMMVMWSTVLAGLLLFSVAQGTTPADRHTAPARPAVGDFCPPLAAPAGPPLTVDTESGIRSQAYNAASGTAIFIAPGTYTLQDYVHVVNAGIALPHATGHRREPEYVQVSHAAASGGETVRAVHRCESASRSDGKGDRRGIEPALSVGGRGEHGTRHLHASLGL